MPLHFPFSPAFHIKCYATWQHRVLREQMWGRQFRALGQFKFLGFLPFHLLSFFIFFQSLRNFSYLAYSMLPKVLCSQGQFQSQSSHPFTPNSFISFTLRFSRMVSFARTQDLSFDNSPSTFALLSSEMEVLLETPYMGGVYFPTLLVILHRGRRKRATPLQAPILPHLQGPLEGGDSSVKKTNRRR